MSIFPVSYTHLDVYKRQISTLAELDAALSSVSDQADAIREGMKTAEKRMKELQKLIEYGKNYTEYKPIHDGRCV